MNTKVFFKISIYNKTNIVITARHYNKTICTNFKYRILITKSFIAIKFKE